MKHAAEQHGGKGAYQCQFCKKVSITNKIFCAKRKSRATGISPATVGCMQPDGRVCAANCLPLNFAGAEPFLCNML